MRLVVDHDALREAESDLGLTFPARITWEKLRARTQDAMVLGRYNGIDPFHPAHNIALNPNLTTRRASATLWHELTHAMQAERLGSFARFDSEYARQLRAIGLHVSHPDYYARYVSIPLEAEACEATNLALGGVLTTLVYAE
jgi:hypothetical protein